MIRAILLSIALVGLWSLGLHSFHLNSRRSSTSTLHMAERGTKLGKNYDPSNYKDSANSGNYRRLSDQLSAAKAEEDQLKKEREELIRKEEMLKFMIKKENETFWNTPGDTKIGTSDKFYIPPQVLQVIDDLDNQLIGLKPVKEKMRRYAAQLLVHKLRA